ncbi:MAG: hypothetical protein QW568_02570 [Candidatus Anstonellaceae archaeon]
MNRVALHLLLLFALFAVLSAENARQEFFITSFSASPQEILPSQPLEFSVSVSSISGSNLPFSATVEIYDWQHGLAGSLNFSEAEASEGKSTTLRKEWQPGTSQPGPYLAVAKIFSDGKQMASSQLFFAIAPFANQSKRTQSPAQCKDYSCTESEGCSDGYRTLYCKSSKGCAQQEFFRVEKCISQESIETALERGICKDLPFLCSKRGIKNESYASACLLPVLAIALFVVFVSLSLVRKGKPPVPGASIPFATGILQGMGKQKPSFRYKKRSRL